MQSLNGSKSRKCSQSHHLGQDPVVLTEKTAGERDMESKFSLPAGELEISVEARSTLFRKLADQEYGRLMASLVA